MRRCKDFKQTCLNCNYLGYKKSEYRAWWLDQHDIAICTKGHNIRSWHVYNKNCKSDWTPKPRKWWKFWRTK